MQEIDFRISGSVRRRSRRACQPCRHRKRRCDGQFPCRTCREFEYECSYDNLAPRFGSPQVASDQSNENRRSSAATEDIPSSTFQAPISELSFFPEQTEEKFMEPNKRRFYDASSAISFPRALSMWLSADIPPRIHSFGYNVGLLPEQFLETPERQLCNMVDLASALHFSKRYFELINSFFWVVEPEYYFQQLPALWNHQPGLLHFELLACFVLLLGSLYTIPTTLQNHQELSRYAQDLLDRSNFCAAPSLLYIDHFQAWILRTMYVRSTTRPNIAWLSSCITMHIAESLGLHRESETMGNLGLEAAIETYSDKEHRRRLYWIAWLLNRMISFEVGRSATFLTDTNVKLPSTKTDTTDIKCIDMYFWLYPNGGQVVTEDLQSCLNKLATVAHAEGAKSPHLALLRADMALGLYRDMHKHSVQSLERSGRRFTAILEPAFAAAQELIEGMQPWWFLTTVPFQCVCASISIGRSSILQMLPEAMRLLQAVNHVFGTKMTYEACETAKQILEAARNSRNTDCTAINSALTATMTWEDFESATLHSYDDTALLME